MTKTYVKIDNWGEIQIDSLIGTIKLLKSEGIWSFKAWTPKPALIDKSSGSSRPYVGQLYDSKSFELVHDGWTHEHCEICSKRITNIEDYGEPQGFELNGDWICEECYKLFMLPDDIEKELIKYQKVEK